jgi:hypothetical protein
MRPLAWLTLALALVASATAAAVVAVAGATSNPAGHPQFDAWMAEYGKSYPQEE